MAQFPSTTSASGEWTLKKQKRAQQGGNWPSISDPYFPYVTMLLHGDGTNGAQNNTFLDSSSSALSITRTGNPTQGSFSPYGSNWSNYFNGSNTSLVTPSSSALQINTGDFSVEAFVFPQAQGSGDNAFVGSFVQLASPGDHGIIFGYQTTFGATDKFSVLLKTNNSTNITLTASSTSTRNQWHHVVVCRSGSTVSLFVDGTQLATGTYSATLLETQFSIGRLAPSGYGGGYFGGFVSNVRVSVGTSQYSASASTITVPTAPLSAASGTALLACKSNRFMDNSSNSFTLTVNNTPSVQEFSPFSPTAAYSTSTLGGSLYTSASGNVLTAPISSNFDVSSGQGAWTGECWIYPTSFSGYKGLFGNRTNANAGWDATLETSTGNATRFGFYNSGGGSTYASGAQAVILNQWNHVALSSDGTTISHYVNGTRTQTSTASLSYQSGVDFVVGANKPAADEWFAGYMSGFRFVKGTQLYSGTTITVPTSPPTDVSNTKLLMNYTNGAIFDNAMMNDLETVGNAQISTSVVKYGTGSIWLNGQGNEVNCIAAQSNISFGTGDFTIECWMYTGSTSGQNMLWSFNWATGVGGWAFFPESSGGSGLVFHDGTTSNKRTWSWSTNTWYHLAVSRSGTSLRLFVDGTQLGATFTNSNSVSALGNYVKIGSNSETNTVGFTGYIDDLRITKGYARYTTNFTPPTGPFPNQ